MPDRDPDNEIDWIDGEIPFSKRFKDSYYSRAGGRAETGHVFINGNDLPARWPLMGTCRIAELGFGTGLNFVETLSQWRSVREPGSKLVYLGFELYPLEAKQMRRALARWPEVEELAETVLTEWRTDSEMAVFTPAPNVELTVFFSDAKSRLPQLGFAADAWYLDGFAPARNPQLWDSQLLQSVFDHTVPGGTFATYSAAGWVRRNLESAGFATTRAPGFAGKREMLRGHRPQPRRGP